jgi:hypothetical protein
MTNREISYLAFLIGVLVLVLIAMVRVRDPSMWGWMFPNEAHAPVAVSPDDPEAKKTPVEPGQAKQGRAKPVVAEPGDADLVLHPEPCRQIDPELLGLVVNEFDPARQEFLSPARIDALRRQSTAAVYHVLCVARSAPEKLAGRNRESTLLSRLGGELNVLRGQPFHIMGTLHRLEKHEPDATAAKRHGIGAVYRAWILVEERRRDVLYQDFCVVLFTKLPPGLQPAVSMKENVAIDAYFLKLHAYEDSQQKWRVAPMLAGYNLVWRRTPETVIGGGTIAVVGGIVALLVILVAVIWWQGRRDEQLLWRYRASAEPSEDAVRVDWAVEDSAVGEAGGISPPHASHESMRPADDTRSNIGDRESFPPPSPNQQGGAD